MFLFNLIVTLYQVVAQFAISALGPNVLDIDFAAVRGLFSRQQTLRTNEITDLSRGSSENLSV